ncbi:Hsp70 family protein [Amycolatopsis cynarae]|uniref:Hsp70 family protein n=1 Tax=Amycolatopsis cynarae TaxID=2995223 RepID=A0ABY7AWL4_9PSEU|nr:Hsp70 family protein [Amycolatopsis sp. HUAS 11-8]WAL63888.1 Hsp70 family protein [Amycolatopsis sp. HUAS 11-8]
MAPLVILGIDLGTTYSAVATVEERGNPVILPNRLGERVTPSVVSFESPGVVRVGSAAREAAAIDPDNTVALIKRRMGTEFELLFHGVRHTPESVSALILRTLVEDARAQLGAGEEPVRAVITVPAYFGLREREATYQAARLAGIEVLELLAEPVAAALHYRATADPGGAILVYDLGGGTFDTTVLRADGTGAKVIATDGDSRLGGADWDERITGFLLESFAHAAGEEDFYADDAFLQDVGRVAETAKRELSSKTSRPVVLRRGGTSVTVPFDRKTLEGLGADLLGRTMAIVDRALAGARARGVPRVGQVILVGGSSKMPAVAEALRTRLRVVPRLAEPDFAVAYGAALRAHQLAGDPSGASRQATASVVPRSFGILVDDSHDPAGRRRIVMHTVHRDDPLPAAATTTFCTIVDGQDRVRVQVFEQAGDVPSEEVEDNRRVLDGELAGIPPLPAGSPIEITSRVSADGLLSVTAVEPGSGTKLELSAYMDGVLDAESTRTLDGALRGLTIRQ